MRYDPPRPPPSRGPDPALRDLLVFLRDTFRDAASRIDRYLGDSGFDRYDARDRGGFDRGDRGGFDRGDRGDPRDRGGRGGDRFDRGGPPMDRGAPGGGGSDPGIRIPLEKLRDEARQISNDAPDMDPAELRLRVEAVTAETRSLQNRATDEEDRDIAAKILRALTAIVSEHRPGHVYGLARHHQADWDEVGRRARDELNNPRGE